MLQERIVRVGAFMYPLRAMSPHCLLTGHDVCLSSDMPSERCVHCGLELPASSIRLAAEALLRGLFAIVLVLCFAAARFVTRHAAGPLPEPVEREDQAAQDR